MDCVTLQEFKDLVAKCRKERADLIRKWKPVFDCDTKADRDLLRQTIDAKLGLKDPINAVLYSVKLDQLADLYAVKDHLEAVFSHRQSTADLPCGHQDHIAEIRAYEDSILDCINQLITEKETK